MNTARNLSIATVALVFTLAVTAVSTLDWDLSHRLVSPGSPFGEFFNRFGELPAVLALYCSILILLGGRNRQVPWRNALSHSLALPLLALAAWAMIFIPFHYVYEFSPGGVPATVLHQTLVLALVLLALSLVLANRIPFHVYEQHKRTAMVIILFVVMEIVLVNLGKVLWGRPRMRSIESIDQFHYWYQVAGPATGEEFKSFPSGHTANGFVMLAFTLLIPVEKKELAAWLTSFALLWGFCVALSRVLLGAHFLSDVVVGGYIAVMLFYSLRGMLIRQTPQFNSA